MYKQTVTKEERYKEKDYDVFKNERKVDDKIQNKNKEKIEVVGCCIGIFSFNRKGKDDKMEHVKQLIQIIQKRIIIEEVVNKMDKIPFENHEMDEKEIEGKLV